MSAQLESMRSYMATNRAALTTPQAPAEAGGPPVIVVGSGKGGTGTSVVAALVALAAASTGKRVLLVDADEHVGPQRYLLGAAASPSIADLRNGVAVESIVVPISATLSLVPGGPPASAGTAPAHAEVDPAERRALLRRVATLYAERDLVVVDGGSRLDTVCASCEAIGGPTARLLVVTGTDPIALAASYALVKAIRERTVAQPGGALLADMIVNREDEMSARRAFTQVEVACREFLATTIGLAGILPDDGCLEVALRAGMPLQDAAAGSPAAVATQTLTERILSDLAGTSPRAASRPIARPAAPSPYAASLSRPAGAYR